MRIYLACLVAVTAFLGAVAPQSAEAQLADQQKAVFAFDIYIDRLRGSELAQETGMDDPAAVLTPANPNAEDEIDVKELRRIFGAISAPPNVAALEELGSGKTYDVPMDLFVRMQFTSPELAEKSFNGKLKESEVVTLGGKEFKRMPAEDGSPTNIFAHMSAPDTIELGTERYLSLPNRNVFSDRLMSAWPKMPRAGIRVALDLDGSRALIDEAMQKAGEIPPEAQPAVSMISNMSVLRLGIDFTGENMFWVTATGRDSGATGQINATLSGLMAMAKQQGQGLLMLAPPDAKEPASVILNALATKVDGDDVNITIPRPDGLEKAVGSMVGQLMMGGMGGMGPGGPGGFAPDGGGFGPDDFGGDPFGDGPENPGKAASEAADDLFN